MAIDVTCPSCEHQFKVPDQYAGRKGRCPKCKEIFRAPDLDVFEEVEEEPQENLAGDEWLDNEPAPPPAVSEPDPIPRVKSSKRPATPEFDLGALGEAAPSTVKLSGPGRKGGKRGASKAGKKRKKTSASTRGDGEGLPKWVLPAAIGGAVLAIFIGIGIVMLVTGGDPPEVAENEETQSPTEGESEGDQEKPAEETPREPLPDPDPAPAELLTNWNRLHAGIVSVTVESASGTKKTLGFVVDSRGLVVVHYHDVAVPGVRTLRAEVGGLPYEFKGAVAASRQFDLVLLELNMAVPVQLVAFEFAAGDPSPHASLYAASDTDGKRGLTPTVLDRIVSSGKLPPSAVAVIRERRMNETDALTWIETSVPPPAAAAGGPLLDAEGKVLGVNTTLSPTSPSGFAIHVRHVAELLEHAREEAVPLEPESLAQLQDDLPGAQPSPEDVAQGDPTEDDPLDPTQDNPPGDEDPQQEEVGGLAPPTEADMREISPEGLAHIHEVCASFDFTPSTEAEYEWMLLLATFVNVAEDIVENPQNGYPQEVRTAISDAVSGELNLLTELQFTPERIEAVNQYALPILEGASDVNVFFYGRVFKASNEIELSTGEGVMLVVQGTNQKVVLPISRNTHPEFTAGSLWLIVGHYKSFTMWDFGDGSEPERLPYVLCRYVIGEN